MTAFRASPAEMQLTREQGCLRALRWRTEMPLVDQGLLQEALLAQGWETRPAPPGLRYYRIGYHEVVLVILTGRVQIRLDIETPHEERPALAERFFRTLVDTLGRVMATSRDA